MKLRVPIASWLSAALVISVFSINAETAYSQGTDAEEALEEVVVTGSRIRRDPLNEAVAIMEVGSQDLDRTGLTNLGDALRQMPHR